MSSRIWSEFVKKMSGQNRSQRSCRLQNGYSRLYTTRKPSPSDLPTASGRHGCHCQKSRGQFLHLLWRADHCKRIYDCDCLRGIQPRNRLLLITVGHRTIQLLPQLWSGLRPSHRIRRLSDHHADRIHTGVYRCHRGLGALHRVLLTGSHEQASINKQSQENKFVLLSDQE
jgi:hypothetical protein